MPVRSRRFLIFPTVLLFLVVAVPLVAQPAPVRVPIVGLQHDHVQGFLGAFPDQHDAQLVGIVDANAALRAKYERQFHLDPGLFYDSLDDLQKTLDMGMEEGLTASMGQMEAVLAEG